MLLKLEHDTICDDYDDDNDGHDAEKYMDDVDDELSLPNHTSTIKEVSSHVNGPENECTSLFVHKFCRVVFTHGLWVNSWEWYMRCDLPSITFHD